MFLKIPFLRISGSRYFTFGTVLFTKSHYDSLGITPKATQAEVKAAYYKLSMVHHPDKNVGCTESPTKFRDITTAYEVLGNVRLRKLYDKGMFHVSLKNVQPTDKDEDPKLRFYRAREHRSRATNQAVYNFDEWTQAHYGATFAREMELKRNRFKKKIFYERKKNETKHEHVVLCLIVLLVMYVCLEYGFERNDVVIYDSSQDNTSLDIK